MINGGNTNGCTAPQISGIGFDRDNNMIIAVLNRGGHQWGWRNRHPKSWNATGLFSTHSDGDILKACWTGSGWIIESTTDGTTICHQNEREPNLNSSAMEFYFGDYAEGEGARGKVH
uniref:Uncharacterized protein n=1 Tax=Grammatophora oceanica TaxID=210454 RepID=A0A7S1YI18_9STRA